MPTAFFVGFLSNELCRRPRQKAVGVLSCSRSEHTLFVHQNPDTSMDSYAHGCTQQRRNMYGGGTLKKKK
jgi:hypothetical protein